MGILSGKLSVVNGVTGVGDLSYGFKRMIAEDASAATLGGIARNHGPWQSSGSYNRIGGWPGIKPGEAFTFQGNFGPNDGVIGNAGNRITTPAIVQSIVTKWDFTGATSIMNTVNFQGTGAPVVSTGVNTDSTQLNTIFLPPCDAGGPQWALDLAGVYALIPNVTSVTLTLTNKINAYVNSSTACAESAIGGQFDWTLDVDQQDVELSTFTLDTIQKLKFKLPVDATNFYELLFGKFLEYANIKVDIKTGKPTSRTLKFAMDASVTTSAKVDAPGVVQLWP